MAETQCILTNANAPNTLSQGIPICKSYTLMGAKDKILDHCLRRSSCPTTPVERSVCMINFAGILETRTVHSRPDRISCLIHQYTRIIAKSHYRSIISLDFFLHPHHDSMSDIAATDFVGDGVSACIGPGLLLLDNDDYSVTWEIEEHVSLSHSIDLQGLPKRMALY